MLRIAGNRVTKVLRNFMCLARLSSSATPEEEFDQRYVQFFSRTDIDGWDIRRGMTELHGMDLIPDPKIIIAALQACRRVNDFALAIRWLEAVKDKCGNNVDELHPYIMENIQPTLNELGIPTLEELNYHKPQLALESVFD